MAGFPFPGGGLEKKDEFKFGLEAIPGQAVGMLSDAAHAAAEDIAAITKTIGLPINKGDGHEEIRRPAAAIVDGLEVSENKEQIEHLLDKIDVLILSGDMIFAFYKAQGLSVGSIPVSDQDVQLAKSILEQAKFYGVKLFLPTDLVVADSDQEYANTKIVAASEIPDGWVFREMGPASVEQIREALNGVNTVLWDGIIGLDGPTSGIGMKISELMTAGVQIVTMRPWRAAMFLRQAVRILRMPAILVFFI